MDEYLYWQHMRQLHTFALTLSEVQDQQEVCKRMGLPQCWGTYFVNEATLWGLIKVEHQPCKKNHFIVSPERFKRFTQELESMELELACNDPRFIFF